MSAGAAALVVVGYLLGSLSPAYALGRVLKHVDLRNVGSRNLGARNAARELGRPVGVAVWLLDMAKGAAAVLLARAAGAGPGVEIAAGAAAVAGHNWPVYHGFRGGRGASTAMGASFALVPLGMSVGLAAWVIVSLVSGSFYLGGLVSFATAALAARAFGSGGLAALSPLIVAVPLLLRHVPDAAAQLRAGRLRLP